MGSVHLPPEIMEQIFQYIPLGYHGQLDHRSVCEVSRSWYASAIKRLYHSPSIIGKNFDAFARTLCPSVNANIRRTELAFIVCKLDMSRLVYSGSKSLTARILGRVKNQLEVFIAPAATFSLLAFSALSKCYQLKHLNLEYVIESLDVVQLIRTVKKLPRLEQLHIRMASMPSRGAAAARKDQSLVFPPSLRKLTIQNMCEYHATELLYLAMKQSNISSLSLCIGTAAEAQLYDALRTMNLKTLFITIGPRVNSPEYDSVILFTVREILASASQVETLSIPIECFDLLLTIGMFNSWKGIHAVRKLYISPNPSGNGFLIVDANMVTSLLQQLDKGGTLQNLKELVVLDRKDVHFFLKMEEYEPDILDKLDNLLLNESTGELGLYLAGHELYGSSG